MKSLSTIANTNHADLFEYAIVDSNQESIGTLHSMWTNAQSGQLEFLGVKTGWLFGSNHVVPAGKAQIDETTRTVQVPYTLALVKEAPAIDAEATISDAQEAEIFNYYGGARGVTTGTNTRSTETTASSLATGAAAASTGIAAKDATHTAKNGGDIEVALSEEQVKVGKRTLDAGSVRLRKVIRTEIVNQPVEVRHEDVVVERVSADQVHGGVATPDFRDETISVPLTREEVVVSKEAHVTGAVRLHKTAETETQNVSETVRKENVEVVRDGKTEVEHADKSARP